MQGMSQKLNHSKDYHNLLDTAVENELENTDKTTSASLWNKMGDQLEIEGVSKELTSAIIRKDIEDKLFEDCKDYILREDFKWHSGYYYRIMKKQGRINSAMSKTNQLTPLGELGNSSINTANPNMLLLCDFIIDVCRNIKEKSKECKPLEEIFGEKEMKEFYFQQGIMIDNIKNGIDNKTKIPENTETFLLECLATVMGNTNKCGEIFQQIIIMHMKEQGKFLTQKQATKFKIGGKQSQLYLLSPTNRDFSIYEGYTGSRCTNCQSFRVRPNGDHNNNWTCFDCDNIMPPQHIPKCSNCQIPLYKERLQHIVKTRKCANCQETVELPQVLIDQANS